MKELEDLPWFPAFLRKYQTDHIGFLAALKPIYAPFLRYVRTQINTRRPWTDLCSGSGEPAISIHHRAGWSTPLTLTDRFPSRNIAHLESVSYCPDTVDARTIPIERGRGYTLFNAFHHFTAAEQLELVRRLRDGGAEAYIVEVLEPTVPCLLKVALATTIGVLLLAPFIPPFSWTRLLFTYVLPINVLTITWDGVVSVMRSHSAAYYRELFAEEAGVQVLRFPGPYLPLTCIHIRPA